MTNESAIKQLNTEQFAEYLFSRGNNTEYCFDICAYKDECESEFDKEYEFCIKHICEWLKAESDMEMEE